MSSPRILVAGIGNIFLGDDAFGVAVAQRMAGDTVPEGVHVCDFGIRGFDLAFAIMDDYDVTIMIDALQRGEPPGTLYVIEPDLNHVELNGQHELETHGMDPVAVLRLVKQMGGQPRRVLVVGCEPATFGPEDEGQMGLSEPVEQAVAAGVALVHSLLDRIIAEQIVGQ